MDNITWMRCTGRDVRTDRGSAVSPTVTAPSAPRGSATSSSPPNLCFIGAGQRVPERGCNPASGCWGEQREPGDACSQPPALVLPGGAVSPQSCPSPVAQPEPGCPRLPAALSRPRRRTPRGGGDPRCSWQPAGGEASCVPEMRLRLRARRG